MIEDDIGRNEITGAWMDWFLGLAEPEKAAIEAYWNETANLPGLERGHRHAGYARRAALIERSRTMGYGS